MEQQPKQFQNSSLVLVSQAAAELITSNFAYHVNLDASAKCFNSTNGQKEAIMFQHITECFDNMLYNPPTVVSHLVLVVGLRAPITQKISKIWRVGANKELTKPVRADLLNVTSDLCWFWLHSRLPLYSCLFTASQPSMDL